MLVSTSTTAKDARLSYGRNPAIAASIALMGMSLVPRSSRVSVADEMMGRKLPKKYHRIECPKITGEVSSLRAFLFF